MARLAACCFGGKAPLRLSGWSFPTFGWGEDGEGVEGGRGSQFFSLCMRYMRFVCQVQTDTLAVLK